LAVGIIVFPTQWWAVAIVWFVVANGFIAWYTVRVRRTRRQAGVSPPEGQSNVEYLRRMTPSLFVGDAGILLLGLTVMSLAKGGPTTPHVVWGTLLLVVGGATLTWAAFLRFRRPPGDS
jgi:hypothetical protein